MPTREEVSARRHAAVIGPLIGLLLFIVMQIMMRDPAVAEVRAQIFNNQPDFVKVLSFLSPWLDLVFCCFYVWLAARLLSTTSAVHRPEGWPHKPKHWLQIATLIFVGSGALGGASSLIMVGWFMSIKVFFFMGAALTMLAVLLVTFTLTVLWLGEQLPPIARALWARVQHWRAAQLLIRCKNYFTAQDIPEKK